MLRKMQVHVTDAKSKMKKWRVRGCHFRRRDEQNKPTFTNFVATPNENLYSWTKTRTSTNYDANLKDLGDVNIFH